MPQSLASYTVEVIEAAVAFEVVSPAERLKANALADRVCAMTCRFPRRSA